MKAAPLALGRLWLLALRISQKLLFRCLERLEAARVLVSQGRCKTVKDAFQLLELGIEIDTMPTPQGPPQEALGVLMGELRAIRQELVALREDNATLREHLQALPAPRENSQAEYVARLEQLYAEADKRAQYAMEELRRRDAQAVPRRPWWRMWGKSER